MSIQRVQIFMENPYDVQCIMDCMRIAKTQNKDLVFLDKLVATLRLDSETDIVNASYRILLDLQLLKLEPAVQTK
jgi:hypothetical protein